jgi:hypothetical protein
MIPRRFNLIKTSFFVEKVEEQQSCVKEILAIEFLPQNMACGIGDDGRCVSGW